MSFSIIGPFLFGLVENKKPLPAGWSYVEKSAGWLKARSPDGRMWFVTKTGVELCCVATQADVERAGFKLGQEFVDGNVTMPFWESE